MRSRTVQKINRLLSRLPGSGDGLFLERPGRLHMLHPARAGDRTLTRAYHDGERIVDLLTVHAGLDSAADVLDAGCGDGKAASALARRGFSGRYFGYDVNGPRIRALSRLFAGRPGFRFIRADLHHSYYNPEGSRRPEDHVYPFEDAALDLVFYNSIFTHVSAEVIRRNLKEARRCLRKGGRVWATFFIIEDSLDVSAADLSWSFLTPWDEGYTAAPGNPEKCVGYDEAVVRRIFEDSGYEIIRVIPGYWKPPLRSLDQHHQDIVVARRRG